MNRTIIATATLLLTTAGAQAMQPVQAVYADELSRCVSLLRGQVADAQTRQLRHTVTSVETRGAWYEFDIRSEAYDVPAGSVVRTTENKCRANRWNNSVEVAH